MIAGSETVFTLAYIHYSTYVFLFKLLELYAGKNDFSLQINKIFLPTSHN